MRCDPGANHRDAKAGATGKEHRPGPPRRHFAHMGQDVAILLMEVPFLLLALRWYRRGGPVAAAGLTGVLAFFTYYYVSMTFATAQNRLFPLYVAAGSLAGFALVVVARRMDPIQIAARLPDRPGRMA
jgi:hypothetical protein